MISSIHLAKCQCLMIVESIDNSEAMSETVSLETYLCTCTLSGPRDL